MMLYTLADSYRIISWENGRGLTCGFLAMGVNDFAHSGWEHSCIII